jgi:hypothetical protein
MGMHRITLIFAAVVFSMAGSALAAGPTTSTRTLNMTGKVAAASPGDFDTLTGACNIDSAAAHPWVDQCSGTNCQCLQVTVTKASGNMNKGDQVVSDFFITLDFDQNPATEATVGSGPNPQCIPFHAILTDTSPTQTKTLNALGVGCEKVIGITKDRPGGKHVGDAFTGGWGIADAPAPPDPDASGWGALTSSDNEATGAASVKLSGLVTE